jgi:hypothetical protein
MASNINLSTTSVNAQANAIAALANSGYLRLYDGDQPATANTAPTTQVLLAELTMNSTAFGVAVDGVITANSITADSSANASGTPNWYRLLQSDAATAVWDGTVGSSSTYDIWMSSTGILAGAQVSVTSMTHTVVK